jgi:hypothetical protein
VMRSDRSQQAMKPSTETLIEQISVGFTSA